MCGIMGYTGKDNAAPIIIDGLSQLEYRGYDSAGIVVWREGKLEITKKRGRLADMATALEELPESSLGIGYIRWAARNVPSDYNAVHPQYNYQGRVAVVHNGIIENYVELRKDLMLEGHDFASETDTEVVTRLIEKYYDDSLEQAVRKALSYLRGSFALAVISRDEPHTVIGAKKGSSLIVGLGEGGNYIASDIPAIQRRASRAYILENGEFAVVTPERVTVTDFSGNPVEKSVFDVVWNPIAAEKGGYEHFMLKEIHEQPEAVRKTVSDRVHDGRVNFSDLQFDEVFRNTRKIFIVGCGTAYHAGVAGRRAIEKLARIPVETDIASEFSYRDVLWQPDNLMIVISQSGETADTLAALRKAKHEGIKVLAVTNVAGSAIAREADRVIYIHAGPEIAIASTKAYSTQLVIMYLLAFYLAEIRHSYDPIKLTGLVREMLSMDNMVAQVLKEQDKIKALAEKYRGVQSAFFLGRGMDYAVAMEGALKLKETSYVHAEAYAAGELKHGPMALIDEGVPVLALITQDELADKTISNIKEVKARGAAVVAICQENLQADCQEYDEQILLPRVDPLLTPIISVVPLQIFAYYMSVFRGVDVDKPRNLVKSVIVE